MNCTLGASSHEVTSQYMYSKLRIPRNSTRNVNISIVHLAVHEVHTALDKPPDYWANMYARDELVRRGDGPMRLSYPLGPRCTWRGSDGILPGNRELRLNIQHQYTNRYHHPDPCSVTQRSGRIYQIPPELCDQINLGHTPDLLTQWKP